MPAGSPRDARERKRVPRITKIKARGLTDYSEKAESLFMQELDVMNSIRTVRMTKVFVNSVMTRRQKLLLRFQK